MLSEYGVYREGICCSTLIKSSHEDEGRWGYAGEGDMRADVRKGMNMEEEKGGQKRGKKRAGGKMWRNRGRNVDGKFCLVPQWEAHAAATL